MDRSFNSSSDLYLKQQGYNQIDEDYFKFCPKNNDILNFFERARMQKLYPKLPPTEAISEDFFECLDEFKKNNSDENFKIISTFFFRDDFTKIIENRSRSDLDEILLDLLKFCHASVRIIQSSDTQIKLKIECNGSRLRKVIDLLEKADVCDIIANKKNRRIGFYSIRHDIQKRVENEIHHHQNFYKKSNKKLKSFIPKKEDKEFLEKISPYIISWLKGRQATLQRVVWSNKGSEIRFYRNSYVENEKKPIIFTDKKVLPLQIDHGAFAFIADTNMIDFETNLPVGPYFATIDLDLGNEIEYDILLKYVNEFSDFLKNQVKVKFFICHSGHRSFHFRFFIGEMSDSERHYILPKAIQYSTLMRRRKDEIKLTYIRDAMEILILAFNVHLSKNKELTNVACKIPKFNHKSRYPIFFDNRTVINGGARVPGSLHTKSGLYSIIFKDNKIPEIEAETLAWCTREHILKHPELIEFPEQNEKQMKDTKVSLFKFTDNFIDKNMMNLIYKDKVFNP